jgi:hypothetical protein
VLGIHGIVADVDWTAELAAVLRRIVELLSRADCDVTWSGYDSAEELRSEVERCLDKVEASSHLDQQEVANLRFLFLPTGPLQETSISSDWGREFVDLAALFDHAVQL